MSLFHLLFVLAAAPGLLAFPNFAIENMSPLLENASEHTRVAIITVSVSPHASLVGDPIIINANPAVHPFVLSRRSTHLWELFTTGEPKLDFETVILYSLVIYAKDNQGATASQTILIQIADVNEPPTFTGSLAQGDQVTEIYILEDTAPGTVIYRAAAKDPEDAVLEYFISPEGSGFTIDSIGTISTAAAFDFESEARSFSLVIKVVDLGGLFTAGNLKIFLINVNNKDPILTCSLEGAAPSVTSINSSLHNKVSVTLDEEIPIGKRIGMCQATDEDNLGDLTFELDPQNVDFIVDRVTVTIIVEIAPANDFSPEFEAVHYSFSVPETSGAFYKVGRVTAIDEDHPPNCVTYKITSGDIEVIQRFWIHPLSGMIELTTQPDYESVKQYNLTVEAVDCDRFHPRTAMTTVTVDIEDENDEAPVCTPSLSKAVIFDNVVVGTNVNGFKLNCHDRDSQDFEMRFEMVSGNENHHFGFDPTRGSNTPKLIVKNPFNFESRAELPRQYHLVVHIIDDNLKYGKSTKPRTGTAIIDIYVIRANMPPPPTTSSEQRKGLIIMYTAINTYKSSDWYIPFIFTLMAVFFVGLVSWVCFLLWKYGNTMGCCQKMAKEVSKPIPKVMKYITGDGNPKEKTITGHRTKKLEVLTETIVCETVFDGEAIDPVSGNVYEYNSRTGARKWKKSLRHQEESLASIYSLPEAYSSEESTALNIPLQG
ncbi:cadherin-related family member 3-like isoform X2 [Lemur catta]|uniref:cadherin-related family member 3-like isoform X2 n=1 Tax=Lemur catta TaxID=9447 RepID=UPI001E26E4B0|nr:cadherin-related family member 3-like isoform X2 [Lemur catta]